MKVNVNLMRGALPCETESEPLDNRCSLMAHDAMRIHLIRQLRTQEDTIIIGIFMLIKLVSVHCYFKKSNQDLDINIVLFGIFLQIFY